MSRNFSRITYGRTVGSWAFDGLAVIEALHSPGCVLDRHYHEKATLAVTLAGQFSEIVSGRTLDCSSSSTLVKPAGEAHANRYGGLGARSLVIELSLERIALSRPLSKLFSAPAHLTDRAVAMLAGRICIELRRSDDVSALVIEGLTLELLANAARRFPTELPPYSPEWLDSVMDILSQRYAGTLGLSAIAAEIGIHPGHLAVAFRKRFGCTVGDYIRRLRVEGALEELGRDQLSIAEIAQLTGFFDQSQRPV